MGNSPSSQTAQALTPQVTVTTHPTNASPAKMASVESKLAKASAKIPEKRISPHETAPNVNYLLATNTQKPVIPKQRPEKRISPHETAPNVNYLLATNTQKPVIPKQRPERLIKQMGFHPFQLPPNSQELDKLIKELDIGEIYRLIIRNGDEWKISAPYEKRRKLYIEIMSSNGISQVNIDQLEKALTRFGKVRTFQVKVEDSIVDGFVVTGSNEVLVTLYEALEYIDEQTHKGQFHSVYLSEWEKNPIG